MVMVWKDIETHYNYEYVLICEVAPPSPLTPEAERFHSRKSCTPRKSNNPMYYNCILYPFPHALLK